MASLGGQPHIFYNHRPSSSPPDSYSAVSLTRRKSPLSLLRFCSERSRPSSDDRHRFQSSRSFSSSSPSFSSNMRAFLLACGCLLPALSVLCCPLAPMQNIAAAYSTPKRVIAHFMVGNTYPYTESNWAKGKRKSTLASLSGG